MTELLIFYVSIVLIISSYCLWSVFFLKGMPQFVGLFLLTFLTIGSYFGLSEILGRPKPINMELFTVDIKNAEVIAARFQEGELIYIWLYIENKGEPIAYIFPWDLEMAKKLQLLLSSPRGARLDYQHSWETRPMPKIYEPPVPKLPDKYGQPEPEHNRLPSQES